MLIRHFLAHHTISVIGLLSALISIFLLIQNVFSPPVFHVDQLPYPHPFALKFSLFNRGSISLNNTRFTCIIDDVEESGDVSSTNLYIDGEIQSVNISPGRTFEYRCPFDSAIYSPRRTILFAKIHLKASYDMFFPWLRWNATSDEFNYDATTQQWVEGTLVRG